MNKIEAIKALGGALGPDDLVVCCNGMIGRELYTYAERPQNFYMIGSMGLGLSIALGLALARPSRRVIALDGDGNVLMGMNALASVGSERPSNLWHVVLDNHTHASTGGQRTSQQPFKMASGSGGEIVVVKGAGTHVDTTATTSQTSINLATAIETFARDRSLTSTFDFCWNP